MTQVSARGLVLYAKSRAFLPAAAATMAVAVVGLALGGARLRLSEASAFAVPWVVLLPMATAVVLAMSLESPMRRLEAGAPRRLSGVKLLHIALLTALGTAGSAINTVGLSGPYSLPAALRNEASFVGIALLGGVALGFRLSWLAPMAWAFASLSAGLKEGRPNAWALPIAPNADQAAAWVSLGIFLLGTLTACLSMTPLRHRWVPEDEVSA